MLAAVVDKVKASRPRWARDVVDRLEKRLGVHGRRAVGSGSVTRGCSWLIVIIVITVISVISFITVITVVTSC